MKTNKLFWKRIGFLLLVLLIAGCSVETKTGEYNLTKVGDVNNTANMAKNVNSELMFGWMGSLWIIVIFVIVLIAVIQRRGDVPVAFGVASFISWALSLFLRALDLVPDMVIFITLVLASLSILMIKLTERV